jgi:hypothetical protein
VKNCEDPKNFKELGFVIVRSLLSSDEVESLRSFIQDKLALHGNKRFIYCHQAYQYPELYLLPFKEKVVTTAKHILGEDLCYYPDMVVQYNSFGNPGWHTDAGSEGYASYLLGPDYRFVKCGIYLQNNTLDLGGGIFAVPKAHKFPVRTGNPRVDFFFKKLMEKLSIRFSFPLKPVRVDTKAGDLLIFDSRLPHAPTCPKNIHELKMDAKSYVTGIPKENGKMVIYWDASNKKMKDDYLENIKRKAKSEKEGDECHFSAQAKHYFPSDFADDFKSKARECGIEIGCFDKYQSEQFKKIFKQKMTIS